MNAIGGRITSRHTEIGHTQLVVEKQLNSMQYIFNTHTFQNSTKSKYLKSKCSKATIFICPPQLYIDCSSDTFKKYVLLDIKRT